MATRGVVTPKSDQYVSSRRILKWKIKQRRQHLGRQLDRDLIDPVEGFIARQGMENVRDPLADQILGLGKILWATIG